MSLFHTIHPPPRSKPINEGWVDWDAQDPNPVWFTEGGVVTKYANYNVAILSNQKSWESMDLRGYSNKVINHLEKEIDKVYNDCREGEISKLRKEIAADEFLCGTCCGSNFRNMVKSISADSYWHARFDIDAFILLLKGADSNTIGNMSRHSALKCCVAWAASGSSYKLNIEKGREDIMSILKKEDIRDLDVYLNSIRIFSRKLVEYKQKYDNIMKTKVVLNKNK